MGEALLEPTDPLTQARRAAIARQDWRGIIRLLGATACEQLPVDALLDKALAQRMLGDLEGAVGTLQAVLAQDPRNFLALLSQGALQERLGRRKIAARLYRRALAVQPPAQAMPPSLAAAAARAQQAADAYVKETAERLRAAAAPLRGQLGGEALARFDEALAIHAGEARVYVQQPMLFHYPRLPSIPFYDRSHFPWLATLEAATPMLQEELAATRTRRIDGFTPYIAYPPGAPVDQWAELNHSPRWTSFFLWRDGVRNPAADETCPRTMALLDSLPLARQPGFAPTVVFSVLQPHTHIPPHTGSSNARLLAHLPLVLPGPARFRVGNETRSWRMGEAWVFDDTIEHEAWNDADEPRVIMILDVWNPLITPAERELIAALMSEMAAIEATA